MTLFFLSLLPLLLQTHRCIPADIKTMPLSKCNEIPAAAHFSCLLTTIIMGHELVGARRNFRKVGPKSKLPFLLCLYVILVSRGHFRLIFPLLFRSQV